MSDLSDYTTAQLKAEIAAREQYEGGHCKPSFHCAKCGETAYFVGPFSGWSYQRQFDQFEVKHRDCKLPGRIVMEALVGGEKSS